MEPFLDALAEAIRQSARRGMSTGEIEKNVSTQVKNAGGEVDTQAAQAMIKKFVSEVIEQQNKQHLN